MNKQQYIERYWRDATPEDAIKEPPMVARFKTDSIWVIDKIIGFRKSEIHKWLWYDSKGGLWICCQVYDTPDPGEGWRLIDTENEGPQKGDEFYDLTSRQWIKRSYPFASWVKSFNRRRIEPPKPKYVPFEWQDREQLRGRLITYVDRNRTVEFRCESFVVDDDGLIVNDAYADWLCKHAVFVDTKEPVGKKVMK